MTLLPITGEEITNPTWEQIQELIDQDYSYWKQNRGSASLNLVSRFGKADWLLFYNDGPYGYVVMDMASNKSPYEASQDHSVIAVHHVGGEPFPVPVCSHVSKETAEKILHHFWERGEIMDFQNWRDIYSLFDGDTYMESEAYYSGTREYRPVTEAVNHD